MPHIAAHSVMYHAAALQLRNCERQAPCATQHNHQSMMQCCGFVQQQHDCGVHASQQNTAETFPDSLPQLFTIGFGRSMHRMACIVAPAVFKDAKAATARAAPTPCFQYVLFNPPMCESHKYLWQIQQASIVFSIGCNTHGLQGQAPSSLWSLERRQGRVQAAGSSAHAVGSALGHLVM